VPNFFVTVFDAIKVFASLCAGMYSRTAVQPYSRTAVQPYSRTAVQPYSRTAERLLNYIVFEKFHLEE